MKKWLLYILCVHIVFVIGGCVEENIVPGEINIKIFDYQRYTNYIPEQYLLIGDFPIAIPDPMGNVKLKTVSFPYDLRLYEGNIQANYSPYYYYEGIHEQSLNLCLNNSVLLNDENVILVNLQLIGINLSNQSAFANFISKDYFYGGFARIFDSVGTMLIFLPNNKNTLSGKIVLFIATYNDYGRHIKSFDNYGEKNVNLDNSTSQNIYFKKEDLGYVPQNTEIHYINKIPNDTIRAWTYTYLTFDDYCKGSDLNIYSELASEGNIVVPAKLPINYKIKTISYVELDSALNIFNQKTAITYPGYPVYIDNSQTPQLLEPPNNAENITDTNKFSFSSDYNFGIYYISFLGPNRHQTYITEKNHFTLGELKSKKFYFLPNQNYRWIVEKIGEFRTMDEFLASPYLLNPKYLSATYSYPSSFRTAP